MVLIHISAFILVIFFIKDDSLDMLGNLRVPLSPTPTASALDPAPANSPIMHSRLVTKTQNPKKKKKEEEKQERTRP